MENNSVAGVAITIALFMGAMLLLLSECADAATSGSVLITGHVPGRIALTLSSLSLTLSIPASNELAFSVEEFSNVRNGFTVSALSANGGKFVSSYGDEIPYTFSYGGSPSAFGIVSSSGAQVGVIRRDKEFRITTPLTDSMEGDYTDTVTLTISAN